MQTVILVYPEFVDYEITFVGSFLKDVGDVATAGLSLAPVTSDSGLQCLPHRVLTDLEPAVIDLLVIPGGKPDNLPLTPELKVLLQTLDQQGKSVAAICAAPVHLARAGLLQGREYTTSVKPENYPEFAGGNFVEQSVVECGNIITAKGNAYLEFALALADRAGMFENPEQLGELRKYFKNLQY